MLRPENQGNGFVRGGELAWNGFFDFLPGFGKNFGARAAYTYVDSGGTRNSAANPYDPNQQTNSVLQGLSAGRVEQDFVQRRVVLLDARRSRRDLPTTGASGTC